MTCELLIFVCTAFPLPSLSRVGGLGDELFVSGGLDVVTSMVKLEKLSPKLEETPIINLHQVNQNEKEFTTHHQQPQLARMIILAP